MSSVLASVKPTPSYKDPKQKLLGHGVEGTTYKTKCSKNDKNQDCIKKIKKIFYSEVIEGTKYQLFREIDFSRFTEKHPEHFLVLKSYNLIGKCKHKQKPVKNMPQNIVEDWKALQKSNICLELVYTPVLEDTVQKIIRPDISMYEVCNLLLQQIYVLNLMRLNGWIHRDIHNGNWMYRIEKTVINGFTPQHFKARLYLIDYGSIRNINHPRNDMDEPDYMFLDIAWCVVLTIYTGDTSISNLSKEEFMINLRKLIKVPNRETPTDDNICLILAVMTNYKGFLKCWNIDINEHPELNYHYTTKQKKFYITIAKNIYKPNKLISYLINCIKVMEKTKKYNWD